MINGKKKPYAILVFGAPMSGKTSFAEHFSTSIEAPFINFNKLKDDNKITRKTALEFIRIIARGKQTIIVEGMTDTESNREEMKKLFEELGYRTALIWVQTDMNAIKQRMLHRYKKLADAKAALSASYEHLEAPNESESPIVISGKHTPQTQIKNVLSRLADLK
jgi:gluconate kinase